MSKVGVADANVDHGDGRLTADLDTLSIALQRVEDGRVEDHEAIYLNWFHRVMNLGGTR